MTSSQIGIESCISCGANMDSEDRLRCVFTGKLNITRHERSMKFDMSPLKNKLLSAEGVKVFAREGNSYFHRFNRSRGRQQCRFLPIHNDAKSTSRRKH
jgi:uncharacterized membrane protein YgaE (UPF0421/DUF939 family)